MNEVLRQALTTGTENENYRLKFGGWKATEQPGVDLLDRDKLLDLMDRG